jgi:hypothetical protein
MNVALTYETALRRATDNDQGGSLLLPRAEMLRMRKHEGLRPATWPEPLAALML